MVNLINLFWMKRSRLKFKGVLEIFFCMQKHLSLYKLCKSSKNDAVDTRSCQKNKQKKKKTIEQKRKKEGSCFKLLLWIPWEKMQFRAIHHVLEWLWLCKGTGNVSCDIWPHHLELLAPSERTQDLSPLLSQHPLKPHQANLWVFSRRAVTGRLFRAEERCINIHRGLDVLTKFKMKCKKYVKISQPRILILNHWVNHWINWVSSISTPLCVLFDS